uniref:Odorant receptor 12 n=1 Tax=Subpsaltria yangi TaxID=1195109 RepID=A0A385IUT6_9HEMI|nr:odorant receptor 12 [Subpsaltria yangi]
MLTMCCSMGSLVAFQFAKKLENEGVLSALPGLHYFFCMMMELGIYCWKASTLMHVSLNTGEAAYGADWMSESKHMGQSVQLIISRSQRPLTLKAYWGIVTMDLETIINVLRATYSYFTFLRQTNN